MLQTEEVTREILRPEILDVTELIAERDKCCQQSYLSVLELLKLRLRVLVIQREDIEQYTK
jgi:hypothetical protein